MFVSVPGDVDGDGVPDVYLSDWSNGARGPSTGRVYVQSGRDGHRLFTFTGETAGEGFGTSPSVAATSTATGTRISSWARGNTRGGGRRRSRLPVLGARRTAHEDIHVPNSWRYLRVRRCHNGRRRRRWNQRLPRYVCLEWYPWIPFGPRLHRLERRPPPRRPGIVQAGRRQRAESRPTTRSIKSCSTPGWSGSAPSGVHPGILHFTTPVRLRTSASCFRVRRSRFSTSTSARSWPTPTSSRSTTGGRITGAARSARAAIGATGSASTVRLSARSSARTTNEPIAGLSSRSGCRAHFRIRERIFGSGASSRRYWLERRSRLPSRNASSFCSSVC